MTAVTEVVARAKSSPMTDLFGDVFETSEEIKKFSEENIEQFFHEVPLIMLEDLAQSVRSMRREVKQDQDLASHRMTETKREFFRNVQWIFELYHSPTPLTFDAVCSISAIDPDVIRGCIAREFEAQIRQFFTAYSVVEPVDAARVARMLYPYLNLAH